MTICVNEIVNETYGEVEPPSFGPEGREDMDEPSDVNNIKSVSIRRRMTQEREGSHVSMPSTHNEKDRVVDPVQFP